MALPVIDPGAAGLKYTCFQLQEHAEVVPEKQRRRGTHLLMKISRKNFIATMTKIMKLSDP